MRSSVHEGAQPLRLRPPVATGEDSHGGVGPMFLLVLRGETSGYDRGRSSTRSGCWGVGGSEAPERREGVRDPVANAERRGLPWVSCVC